MILALGVAALTTKISGLPARSHKIDRGADGAKIVRARPGRDDDQLGDRDDALDRHGDRRRRVDHREAEALLAKDLEIGGEPRDGGLGEGRHVGLALVPPVGKAALRIDVDQADRAGARTAAPAPQDGRTRSSYPTRPSAMPLPRRACFSPRPVTSVQRREWHHSL